MVDGRRRDQWQHTAEVLAMLANTVRNRKKRRRPFRGKEFYPFRKESWEIRRVQLRDVIDLIPGEPGGARKRAAGASRRSHPGEDRRG